MWLSKNDVVPAEGLKTYIYKYIKVSYSNGPNEGGKRLRDSKKFVATKKSESNQHGVRVLSYSDIHMFVSVLVL